MKDFTKIFSERSKPGLTNIMLKAAFILFSLAMFIVPFLSEPRLSITGNTISDLGAQSTSSSWIINVILVSLSAGSLIAAWKHYEGFLFHKIILILFCVSLAFMAFFNHSPADASLPYNIVEDAWNRFFTGTMILAFIILAWSTGFILERNNKRILSFCAGALVILLTVLTHRSDEAAGLWQRIELGIMIGWMMWIFEKSDI